MAETWYPVELSFEADGSYANPYTAVSLSVRFEHESGASHTVSGFPDGEETWRVRFAPPQPGEWTWQTESTDPGLVGSGQFGVTPAGGTGRLREHGFLEADGRELRHSDGEPFFWLGDTIWSAGAKATREEIETYVDRRAEQGFTVAQINTLPQHDASLPQNRIPFVDWDLERPDPAYFQTLDGIVATCHDRGIVPALVTAWYDYVEGENPDWDVAAGERHPFGRESVRQFGEFLGARYGSYGAVWFLSGDATFAEGTLEVYDELATGLREATVAPLCTVHMPGGRVTPEAINDREWLDFHLYQSSHTADLERPARQAEACRALDPKRPVINGEPPYEGHGLFDEGAGERITRELARRAAWISVLAGANAGITYGGHGLWQWHRRGSTPLTGFERVRPDTVVPGAIRLRCADTAPGVARR